MRFASEEPATPEDEQPEPAQDTGIEKLSDGRVVVTLRWPITVRSKANKDELVHSLTLRRPVGKDMKKAPKDKDQAYQMLEFAAQLVEAESPVVGLALLDRCDLEDIARLSEVVAGFLPGGLLTGQAS